MNREAIPELKCISPETAAREGYVPITVPISPRREPEVFESVQRTLVGTNARWIETGGGCFTAARHKSDLKELERRQS